MVFHWSWSDNKSTQVTTTLLSILADLNNSVVLMVSTHPVISKSYSPCTNPLVTVPSAPITIGMIITFIFHIFFKFPSKVAVLIPLFAFFQFLSVVRCGNKVHNSASSLFLLLIIVRLGCLAEIRWSFVSQDPWGINVFHSLGQLLGCVSIIIIIIIIWFLCLFVLFSFNHLLTPTFNYFRT